MQILCWLQLVLESLWTSCKSSQLFDALLSWTLYCSLSLPPSHIHTHPHTHTHTQHTTYSMCMVLHPHSHGHGDHGHGNKRKNRLLEKSRSKKEDEESGNGKKRKFWQRKKKHHKHGSEENINVRAAFIHVIGDLIQSVGVVIAGYIIKFKVRTLAQNPKILNNLLYFFISLRGQSLIQFVHSSSVSLFSSQHSTSSKMPSGSSWKVH